jgi:hypothetical protein
MKKNVFMYLAVTALLFVGCSKMEQVYPIPGGELSNVPVELSGVIHAGNTRITGPIAGTMPPNGMAVSVFRANTTYGTQYNTKLGGTFTGGKIAMSPKQYYPVDGSSIKFIAVHPENGTYDDENRTVEFLINGSTDILCSNVVEGSKTGPAPGMTFRHLLTQVKVMVIADGTNKADVPSEWGEVTGVAINGKAVPALVTLPAPTGNGAASIAQKPGATGTNLAVTKASGVGANLAIPTGTAAAEFGYAMFLPSTADETLTLTITTTKTTGVETITNTAKSYAGAGIYVITIKFRLGGGIDVDTNAATSDLQQWSTPSGNGVDAELN